MARPKVLNRRVKISARVKPQIRTALSELSRLTGKSRSELTETAINNLFQQFLTKENEFKAMGAKPGSETAPNFEAEDSFYKNKAEGNAKTLDKDRETSGTTQATI